MKINKRVKTARCPKCHVNGIFRFSKKMLKSFQLINYLKCTKCGMFYEQVIEICDFLPEPDIEVNNE